jgi:hypothetical protein
LGPWRFSRFEKILVKGVNWADFPFAFDFEGEINLSIFPVYPREGDKMDYR